MEQRAKAAAEAAGGASANGDVGGAHAAAGAHGAGSLEDRQAAFEGARTEVRLLDYVTLS